MIEVSVWIKRAWLIDLDAYWWLILLWIFTFNLIINYCIEWVREKWKRKKENLSTTICLLLPYFLKKSSKSLNYSPIDFIFEKTQVSFFLNQAK